MAQFMLKYNSNINKLKQFRINLVELLRNQVETRETPESTRLIAIISESRANLQTREDILSRISRQIDDACDKITNATSINEMLNNELKKAEESLELFSEKDSYQILQKAKKKHLIESEWEAKKLQLNIEIESTKRDLDAFLNTEKTTSDLKKNINSNENEIKRLENYYNEEIRQVETEIALGNSTHATMLDQIKKELIHGRTDRLKQEKRETSSQLKSLKMVGDKLINSINKKRSAALRNPDKMLKRCKTDSDAINIINNLYSSDLQDFRSVLNSQISEAKAIVQRYKQNYIDTANQKISNIERQLNNLIMVSSANKDRVEDKTIERNIELNSLTQQIVVVEGVLNDLENEYSKQFKRREENEKKLDEIAKERNAEMASLSTNIASAGDFIERAFVIIKALKLKIDGIVYSDDTSLKCKPEKRAISSLIPKFDINDDIQRRKELRETSNIEIENETEICSQNFETDYGKENMSFDDFVIEDTGNKRKVLEPPKFVDMEDTKRENLFLQSSKRREFSDKTHKSMEFFQRPLSGIGYSDSAVEEEEEEEYEIENYSEVNSNDKQIENFKPKPPSNLRTAHNAPSYLGRGNQYDPNGCINIRKTDFGNPKSSDDENIPPPNYETVLDPIPPSGPITGKTRRDKRRKKIKSKAPSFSERRPADREARIAALQAELDKRYPNRKPKGKSKKPANPILFSVRSLLPSEELPPRPIRRLKGSKSTKDGYRFLMLSSDFDRQAGLKPPSVKVLRKR